jgi:hypothetical protein
MLTFTWSGFVLFFYCGSRRGFALLLYNQWFTLCNAEVRGLEDVSSHGDLGYLEHLTIP